MNLLTVLIGVCVLIFYSLWLRVVFYRATNSSIEPINIKPSPLSQAVQDLVATAGGVYLSIIMLVSFLHIDTQQKITILDVQLDPIALLALILAIIQPILIKFYHEM